MITYLSEYILVRTIILFVKFLFNYIQQIEFIKFEYEMKTELITHVKALN